MKIHIKYMVTVRCIEILRQILQKLEIPFDKVEMGYVEVPGEISPQKMALLKQSLQDFKLDIIMDNQDILIEKIKNLIIDMIYNDEEEALNVNFSHYLEEKLNQSYNYLARKFTEVVGMTIEKFIIATKVERIKSFLVFDDLTLTEISFRLNYSSVAHLSNQFKNITGMTPSFFKEMQTHRRGRET